MDDPLVERSGEQVLRLLGDFELLGDGGWRGNPGDAVAGRQRFGKAAQVHDASVSIVGFDRPHLGRRGRVLEIQVVVRVVLDDEDVAVGGPRQQPPALLEADQEARWILEVGHDIQRFHPAAVQTQPLVGGFERVELDAVRLLRHADHLGLDVSKRRDRAGVGWQLDEHHVAGIEQDARNEIESLLRAGRDEQLLESHANLATFEDGRDFLEQRAISPGRSVLQHTPVLPAEQ